MSETTRYLATSSGIVLVFAAFMAIAAAIATSDPELKSYARKAVGGVIVATIVIGALFTIGAWPS